MENTSIENDGKNSCTQVEILKLRVKDLEQKIHWQGNTFDQIDSKTGVTLGFISIMIGQILAATLKLCSDSSHIDPCQKFVCGFIFALGAICILLALIFGFMARTPRTFKGSADLKSDDWDLDTQVGIYKILVKRLGQIVIDNDDSLEAKGRWAELTYVFAGMSLFFFLLLATILYYAHLMM